MLRNFKYHLLALFVATNCFAQALPIRNDTPSNLRDLGANLNVGRNFSVDQKGKILLGAPGTGATDLGKAEDAASAGGDTGVAVFGIRNDNKAANIGSDGDYGGMSVTNKGELQTVTGGVWTGSTHQLAAFPEDAAGSNGDALWLSGCQVNSTGTSVRTGSDADYGTLACTTTGALQVVGIGQNLGKSVFRLEDDVWTSGDALIPVGGQNESAMTVAQSAANDVANLKLDLTGRLMVGPAPHGEFWQSCGTATASTSDVAIKAAVASNRIYVTSLVCKNTSATVATSLDFKDNTTIIAVGGISQMATTAAGSFDAVFPTPLRGSVNTAFNFATNVSVSSVTCCGAGFISVD